MFPDFLRNVSSAATSPVKSAASPSWTDEISTHLQSALEFDGFEPQDIPTLKAPTPRSPKKSSTANVGVLNVEQETDDDFNQDFELPQTLQPLELSYRKHNFNVSSPTLDDLISSGLKEASVSGSAALQETVAQFPAPRFRLPVLASQAVSQRKVKTMASTASSFLKVLWISTLHSRSAKQHGSRTWTYEETGWIRSLKLMTFFLASKSTTERPSLRGSWL